MPPPPDLSHMSLADVARAVAEQKLPPVADWNPGHCGHSQMKILRGGRWLHEGQPISRPEMIRLFANILRRERDGSYVLVTPAEKLDIDVEDAPFVATAMTSEGAGVDRRLAFQLNTGDIVIADSEHRLRFEPDDAGVAPYLHVRNGLEARLTRSVYYELAALAIEADGEPAGVWSNGCFFAMSA